jgi:hypothetical protein
LELATNEALFTAAVGLQCQTDIGPELPLGAKAVWRLDQSYQQSCPDRTEVVYAKPPFGGPEHVLHYLARYTHRVAISNHRIVAVDESQVLFRWKDYAHHNKQRAMPLTCEEFLRRFLQHVLPKGFPRIRYFGWLANRRRCQLLPLCRDLLPPQTQETSAEPEPALWLCPRCHGPMSVLERLTAIQLLGTEGRQERILDSS